jgi:hypothetical protein
MVAFFMFTTLSVANILRLTFFILTFTTCLIQHIYKKYEKSNVYLKYIV